MKDCLIQIKDNYVVEIETDSDYQKGCDTCDYGCYYFDEICFYFNNDDVVRFRISQLNRRYIYIRRIHDHYSA